MRLFPLQPAMVPLFLYGLLCVPSITPHSAGLEGTSQTFEKIEENEDNSITIHNLTISGLSSNDTKKNIFLDSPVHLQLECIFNANTSQLQNFNVTWKHGDEEIIRNLYQDNNTGEWRTTLEVFVADVNRTGNYSCVFSSTSETKATFHIKVPPVLDGGKTLVVYNGDSTILKCNSSIYKPVEWLWYKVSGNEQVLLNVSSKFSKYKQVNKSASVTKLNISDLAEGDSGTFVCKAVFKIGESEGQVHVKVLSLMGPLKVFLAILAEVVVLVTIILGYEMLSKKKPSEDDEKSEEEQMTQLKSEENGEASTTRQRKV